MNVAELIDESHVHVMIVICPHCTQRFVWVFTERIDWTDGDDPQEWTLLPVTELEAAELAAQGDALTESMLNCVGPDRRCLRIDRPKGAPEEIFWGAGMSVGMHD